MLDRGVEQNILHTLSSSGIGFTAFCPIAQGILTDKYLNGIPDGTRAALKHHLKPETITPRLLAKINALNSMAAERGQSLAQMATAWLLSRQSTTSVIIGSRTVEQLSDSLNAIRNTRFTGEELIKIDQILAMQ